VTVRSLAGVACPPSRARGERQDALAYVPGSSLRGALAASYLQIGAAGDEAFRQLADACHFGNLYPAGSGGLQSRPVPLTAVTCGRMPGFRAGGGHGVTDTLLPREAAALSGEPPAPVEPSAEGAAPSAGPDSAERRQSVARGWESLVHCARCDTERQRPGTSRLVSADGFAQWLPDGPNATPVSFDAVYGGAISAAPRAVGAGSYFQRCLAEGQRFTSSVICADEEAAALVSERLAPPGAILSLGSGRSRGLGTVNVEEWRLEVASDSLTVRQEGLTEALASWRRQLELPAPQHRYFSVTLLSPAILRDPFGRFRVWLDGQGAASVWGLPAGSMEIRQQLVRTGPVEGWNAGLGLPKADALALQAGSCWLVRTSAPDGELPLAALEELEAQGLGERRQEGFGAVRVCDPIHWRLRELEQDQPL